MATNQQIDVRSFDRRLFALVAILFPVFVVVGFARTYYLKYAFSAPPLPSLLLHLHGLVMTLWVLFFVGQVWLIRSKNHRVHMKMGLIGVAFAIVIVVVGFFTAVATAKYPTGATPPGIEPLAFLAVPFFDMFVFAILFGAAIYYRKRPVEHKRLILLTAICFLPPAVARFPFEPFISGGPLIFFGVPSAIAILLLAFDTWRNRKLNAAFALGTALLIVSYPIRLALSASDAWTSFATWLTTWAA